MGTAEIAAWESLQASAPSCQSPFLSPHFALAVDDARGDALVAIVRDGERAACFLPFHRTVTRRGRPIGTKLNDAQGAIADPALSWSAVELLRGAGLRSFGFDHLVPGQAQLDGYVRFTEPSPVLDLSGGFDAYVERQRALGRGGPRDAMTKRRRLERRASVRVVIDERDPGVLRELFRLKSGQFRATGAVDALGIGWVAATLERLADMRTEHFSGLVSALYADDALIAVHLGLRHRGTLHYWFPAYDPEWSRYSPGSVLLLEMAEAMASEGVDTFDLGKGREGYKERFAGGDYPVGGGSIELGGPPARIAAGVGRRISALALRSPLGDRTARFKRRRDFG